MNKKKISLIKLYVLLLFLLIVNNKIAYTQQKNLTIPKVSLDSTFKVSQDYNDSLFNGDRCVANNICIFDCDTLLKFFGWPVIEKQIKNNREDPLLNFAYFVTANNKQYLRIVQIPSYPIGDYYEVGYLARKKRKKYLRLPIKKLITNTNVALGMRENLFLAEKGRGYTEVSNKGGIRRYVYMWKYQDAPHGSHYLCFYEFRNAKLIRFGFGVSDRVWN